MCVCVCAQVYKATVRSAAPLHLQPDRMLLIFQCDLHKKVVHKAAAARTCAVHADTWSGHTKVIVSKIICCSSQHATASFSWRLNLKNKHATHEATLKHGCLLCLHICFVVFGWNPLKQSFFNLYLTLAYTCCGYVQYTVKLPKMLNCIGCSSSLSTEPIHVNFC